MIPNEPKIIPYKYILIIAMLFVTIDLAAVSVAYKMVSINSLLELNSAATFIFPLTYGLGDIVTEVYGYSMARSLIWISLFLQLIFSILVTLAIHLPTPTLWAYSEAYNLVFGSIFRFVLAGTIANISSNFLNIYIVSRLKIPFEGKFFWARSILSTLIGGLIMVVIIVGVGFSSKSIDLQKSWIMLKSTYSLEIIYAFLLSIPAAFVAQWLKKEEKIDVYDYEINFNPFFFKYERNIDKIAAEIETSK